MGEIVVVRFFTFLSGIKWASSRKNLSTGFPTKRVSDLSPQLENRNFTCRKFTYYTFQKANHRGACQIARMHRLVCACVVRKPPKTGFLSLPSISVIGYFAKNNFLDC